jgi:DNA adenine methylase
LIQLVFSQKNFVQRLNGGFGNNWSYCIDDSRGGMSSAVRRWQSGLERLPQIHRRLKRVQIEQCDWHSIISRFDGAETLFYLDPPYVLDTRIGGGYQFELAQADHKKLVALLLNIRGMAVLSGYRHEAYEPLESAGWHRVDYNVPAQTSPSRGRRVECIWLSPTVKTSSVAELKQPDLFSSPTENMRQGAYHTHKVRISTTEEKLILTINELRNAGERISLTSVAKAANMSREHLGRKYRHLFDMTAMLREPPTQ